jgi:queuosine biosynthesis protein QueC
MKRVLVLSSGGLDSTVLLSLYKHLEYDVHALYIPYGNKNFQAECVKITKMCEKLDIPLFTQVADFPYSESACLKGIEDNERLYLEMRNLVLLSMAVSTAQSLDIDEVAIGLIGASSSYPDCSPQFINEFATTVMNASGIVVSAPLINMSKYAVYRLGKKLGVNLKDTFSCNVSNNQKPCGKCPDCLDIMRIIEKEEVPDEDNPFL